MKPLFEQHGEYQINREGLEEALTEQSLSRCLAMCETVGGSADAARIAHQKFIDSPDFQRMVDAEVQRIATMIEGAALDGPMLH